MILYLKVNFMYHAYTAWKNENRRERERGSSFVGGDDDDVTVGPEESSRSHHVWSLLIFSVALQLLPTPLEVGVRCEVRDGELSFTSSSS